MIVCRLVANFVATPKRSCQPSDRRGYPHERMTFDLSPLQRRDQRTGQIWPSCRRAARSSAVRPANARNRIGSRRGSCRLWPKDVATAGSLAILASARTRSPTLCSDRGTERPNRFSTCAKSPSMADPYSREINRKRMKAQPQVFWEPMMIMEVGIASDGHGKSLRRTTWERSLFPSAAERRGRTPDQSPGLG